MNWVLGASALLLVLLLIEAALVRRAANAIPCRVLVTGTRGKSSVVRALHAGLRALEPETWGKITGDVASVLPPDGIPRKLGRRGPAHLREQSKLVRDCRRHGARCLVVESMAISPEAMAAEARLLRPTLVVVTNVRDDHRETLGPDLDGQRGAYLSSIPPGSRWLTLDEELLAFAARSGRYATPVPRPDFGESSSAAEENAALHETVATAGAALEALGQNMEPARRAVRRAASGQVLPPRVVSLLGEEMDLVDAFSANDLQSLDRLWSGWRREAGAASAWSVLLNTRADRPLRTQRFCGWVAACPDIDRVFVSGSHASAALRMLRGRALRVARVPRGEPRPLSTTGGTTFPEEGRDVLFGIGNVRGLGLRLRAASGVGGRS